MDASRALRPLGAAAAAALLLTGAACNGHVTRRDAVRQTSPTSSAPAAITPTTTPAPAPAPNAQAVRTDDLDAGLQQADTQLSQTGGAVGDADQNTQQNSD